MRLRFLEFVLDTKARVLLRGQHEIAVEPQVFDCIEFLARQAGVLVPTAELRSRLWSGVHVAESAPRRVINEARRVLGDTGATQSLIRTRKRLGYVFAAAVTIDDESTTADYDPLRTWPFVGRQRELAVLERWLGSPGSGGLCFVSGEAGAGKSRLLERLREDAADRGPWFLGQCHGAPEQPPFWPFREIARQLLAHRELRAHTVRLAQRAACVSIAIPELAADEHVRRREPDSAQARFESCEAWAGLLAALARIRPLRIAVEDAHWADEGSVWMLAALTRVARQAPLHVLVTYRTEALPQARALGQLIARASGREGVLAVPLAGLSQDALAQLLGALEFRDTGARLATQLLRMTAGNALFVHELVRHALATSSAIGAALPASFNHIVAERVSVVPERARELLELAAVLGSEFDIDLLRSAAAYPSSAKLLSELEPALGAGLVHAPIDAPDRLSFSHALVCEALAAGLPVQRRQAHHLAVLRALRSQPTAASHAALASHAFEAGSAVPASERLALCERAGREAFERLEFARAALQLGRAVALLAPEDAPADAAALTLLWAKARWHADDPHSEVGATLLTAAERARRAGLSQVLAEAAILYAVGDESLLDNRLVFLRPDAPALVEEAWQSVLHAAGGDVENLSGELAHRLATVLAWFRVDSGEPGVMRRWTDLALRLAPTQPSPGRRSLLFTLRAAAHPEDAPAVLGQLAAHVCQPGLNTRERIEGRIMLMALGLTHADFQLYERAVREVEQLAHSLTHVVHLGHLTDRLSIYTGIPLLAQITLHVLRGQLAEAGQRFAALPSEAGRLGLLRTRRGEIDMFALWRWLAAYQGRSHALEPLLGETLGANPDGQWLDVFLKLHFALERGALQEAGEHFRSLRAGDFQPLLGGQPQPARLAVLMELGDACAHVGATADAALLYERLSPGAGLVICDGILICFGACDRVLGALATQLGRHADAEHHFQQALAVNTRLAHKPELVRTQLGLARLYRETLREREAERWLALARSSATAMGMAGFGREFGA